ncbi:MAG: hypothetical protein WAP03_24970 [Methylorubrum rhodinum]|uniref:hypothetical protein n=1 Tax=Methylorubrum rhodinum TaxID=29428 RepID=UPI003BAF9B69
MGDDTTSATTKPRPVTFLGRGLALRSRDRLTLLVCPLCSQRNGERMAALGTCVWCGYEPSARDEQPLSVEVTSVEVPSAEPEARAEPDARSRPGSRNAGGRSGRSDHPVIRARTC